MGAIAGGGVALAFGGDGHRWVLPLMLLAGAAGGAAWAAIPALLRTRFNAHEILTTLMLVYVADAVPRLSRARPLERPGRLQFPADEDVRRRRAAAGAGRGIAAACRLPAGAAGGAAGLAAAEPHRHRLPPAHRAAWHRRPRAMPASPPPARSGSPGAVAARWPGWPGVLEAAGPIGQLQPSMSPGLRLRRHHRRLRRPAASVRHPRRVAAHGAALSRRRAAQVSMQLPIAATGTIQGMLLFFLLATDVFIDQRLVVRPGCRHA